MKRLFTCHASTLKSSQLDLTASPTLMPSRILDSQSEQSSPRLDQSQLTWTASWWGRGRGRGAAWPPASGPGSCPTPDPPGTAGRRAEHTLQIRHSRAGNEPPRSFHCDRRRPLLRPSPFSLLKEPTTTTLSQLRIYYVLRHFLRALWKLPQQQCQCSATSVPMESPWKLMQPVSERQCTSSGVDTPRMRRCLATSATASCACSLCRKMNLVGRMYWRVSQPWAWYTWLYLLRFWNTSVLE